MKSNSTRLLSLVLGRLGLAVLLALSQLTLAHRAAAQVPERFSFQGYMEDGNSQPLGPTTPVNYAVVFRIFPTATGGTTNWSERQIVTFDKGNYSVILGQGTQNGSEPHGDLSAVVITAPGSELYIQTTVTIDGNDTTLFPRLRLLPTTYAFLAKKALVADQALNVAGSAIAAGSIQQDRLSTALVASILTAPIPDSRLSANVVSGPIADSRLSASLVRANLPNTFTQPQQFNSGLYTAGTLTQLGTALTTVNGILIANGPVGIGTNGTSKLIVNGGVRARGGAPGLDGASDNGYAFSGNNGDTDSGMFSSANGQLEFYANNSERMRISSVGRVGIGTISPRAPLEVRGKQLLSYGSNTAHFGMSGGGPDTTGNGPRNWDTVSIFAEGLVSGQAFIAFSDARIKQNLQPSDAAKDLATILQLKVTDYRLTDWVANGRQRKKGFIAQEVKSLIPEAVTVSRDFIPDIFAPAVAVTVQRAAGTMTVKMASAHGLQAGDKVRLMIDDAPQEVVVTKTGSATEFEVGQIKGEPKRVFVYGREVSDFLAVDYDRIFTTGIAAIQELARKVKELESKQAQFSVLEQKASRAEALEKANIELQGRLERQDKRLAALESLVREKLQGVEQAGLRAGNVPDQN